MFFYEKLWGILFDIHVSLLEWVFKVSVLVFFKDYIVEQWTICF